MISKKNKVLLTTALCSLTLLFSACSKDNHKSSTTENTNIPAVATEESSEQPVINDDTSTQETTEADTNNYVISRLTGEKVPEEIGLRTPVAVMINNIKEAIPQSGISNADILFEACAEGGITRLMGIFENYEGITEIGSIRSCRTYYLYFSKEFEASYFHFGQSDYALPYLAKSELRSLSLMGPYAKYCYRDSEKTAPHNVYTTGEALKSAVDASGMSTSYPDGYISPLHFNTDSTKEIEPDGDICNYFSPGYNNNKAYFEYDAAAKIYKRYQYGGPHIDANNNEQLTFKNLIVKYVTGTPWPNGTPNYDNVGSGRGIFITNGKAVEINWKKETEFGATQYYYDDGTEITLNTGKTYICYVEKAKVYNIEIH